MKAGDFARRRSDARRGASAPQRRPGDRRAGLRAALEHAVPALVHLARRRRRGAAAPRRADRPSSRPLGDELGLAKALWLRSEADVVACRWQARADALERALAHARRAPDVRDEAGRSPALLAQALYYGPTPVDGAIARCEELLAGAGGDRPLRAALTSTLAGLHAMRGEFDPARRLYADAVAVYDELGLRFRRALARDRSAPQVELARGRLRRRRARAARGATTRSAQIGERGVRSTLGAVLADLLAALGARRGGAELAHEVARPRRERRPRPAGALARRARGCSRGAGELDEADRLAHEALALHRATPTSRHFARLRPRRRGGRRRAAWPRRRGPARCWREARALCAAKGNVVAARALAARLEAPSSDSRLRERMP